MSVGFIGHELAGWVRQIAPTIKFVELKEKLIELCNAFSTGRNDGRVNIGYHYV